MTRLCGTWVKDAATQAIFDALAPDSGYFVGGCVRNALLGMPVSDIDISTPVRPQEVLKRAALAGLKAIPTGIDHGTITVVSGSVPHEVTTFRRDVATDGRRAVVAFSDHMEEDALRRDFTMNALYADRHGVVLDPLGGVPDLQDRRVRFIEDANRRIQEDYLRILRFFRFCAVFGDPSVGPDSEGLAACAENSSGIDTLSKERIGAEIRKLLAAPDPAPALASMAAAGCLGRVLPGADATQVAPLIHLEDKMPPDPIRRLAVLGGEDPRERLRLSKAEARRLTTLREAVQSGQGAPELAYRHGLDLARDAILVRHAFLSTDLPETLETQLQTGAAAAFPVRASDLPDLEGANLGRALKTMESQWVDSGFTLSLRELLQGFSPTPRDNPRRPS